MSRISEYRPSRTHEAAGTAGDQQFVEAERNWQVCEAALRDETMIVLRLAGPLLVE